MFRYFVSYPPPYCISEGWRTPRAPALLSKIHESLFSLKDKPVGEYPRGESLYTFRLARGGFNGAFYIRNECKCFLPKRAFFILAVRTPCCAVHHRPFFSKAFGKGDCGRCRVRCDGIQEIQRPQDGDDDEKDPNYDKDV